MTDFVIEEMYTISASNTPKLDGLECVVFN